MIRVSDRGKGKRVHLGLVPEDKLPREHSNRDEVDSKGRALMQKWKHGASRVPRVRGHNGVQVYNYDSTRKMSVSSFLATLFILSKSYFSAVTTSLAVLDVPGCRGCTGNILPSLGECNPSRIAGQPRVLLCAGLLSGRVSSLGVCSCLRGGA